MRWPELSLPIREFLELECLFFGDPFELSLTYPESFQFDVFTYHKSQTIGARMNLASDRDK